MNDATNLPTWIGNFGTKILAIPSRSLGLRPMLYTDVQFPGTFLINRHWSFDYHINPDANVVVCKDFVILRLCNITKSRNYRRKSQVYDSMQSI